MAGTHYSLWRERDGAYGTLFVSAKHEAINVHLFLPTEDEEAFDLDFEDWHDGLRKRELLITPMIWRLGACVENKVAGGGREAACIVPSPEATGTPAPLFCPDECSYWILSREGVPPRKLNFLKILERLIPVGEMVYVKLRAPGVEALGLQTLRTERSREYLAGRLNVPTVEDPVPGKLYVTCMQKPVLARSDASDMACITLVLDPWEVALDIKEGEPVVTYLVTPA